MKFAQNGPEGTFLMSYKALLAYVNRENKNYTLNSANKLFGSDELKYKQSFLDATRDYFGAQMQTKDFFNKTDASRNEINTWVADQTNQTIKDLLPESAITKQTIMILVNAIYFKGLWVEPFLAKNTQNKPFHVSNSVQRSMSMMYIQDKFNIAELTDMKAKILEIPYQGKDVSMVILLPDIDSSMDGEHVLAKWEAKLDMNMLTSMMSKMSKRKVRITLPKFKLTQEMSLKKALKDMGIMDAFGDAADFGNMAKESLAVSEVAHKAFIDVNEEGTEAAAATGVVTHLKSYEYPVKFTADHPFIFLIREKSSNSILFMGRLMIPPAEGGEANAFGSFGSDQTTGCATTLYRSMSLFIFSAIISLLLVK
jgi:serpin B